MTTTFATHVDQAARRVVQQAALEATVDYWNRRADQYEASAPRSNDFIGIETTPESRAEREQVRQRRVAMLRHRASLCYFADLEELLEAVLAEQGELRLEKSSSEVTPWAHAS